MCGRISLRLAFAALFGPELLPSSVIWVCRWSAILSNPESRLQHPRPSKLAGAEQESLETRFPSPRRASSSASLLHLNLGADAGTGDAPRRSLRSGDPRVELRDQPGLGGLPLDPDGKVLSLDPRSDLQLWSSWFFPLKLQLLLPPHASTDVCWAALF